MTNTGAKRYAAFISYRHLSPDQEIARKLHWLLEHNHVRPHRGVPRRIRPVFIDLGELPITADLSEDLELALRNSECLFVVCSPNLPLSRYCLREIEYFKQQHGGRLDRVYTILVDGTPAESFPEALRFEISAYADEGGAGRAQRREVEPLFADVRAGTLARSLKLLKRREYLRLAAGYYGCSYDGLYKRHRRWIIRVAAYCVAAAFALSLGFLSYSHVRRVQYARAEADTYAAYAEERLEAGDEMLAMILGLNAYDAARLSGSERLMTALRSAAVQYAYKLGALPLARAMSVSYDDARGTVFYLGAGERHMLIADVQQDAGYAAFDTRTGMRLTNYAFDRIFVSAGDHELLVSVGARTDADGVTRDYCAVYRLPENALLGEHAFRETGPGAPSYTLSAVGEYRILLDGGEPVAFFDDAGNDYDRESMAQNLIARGDIAAPDDAPFRVEKKKVSIIDPETLCVVDPGGAVALPLNREHAATAFSPDYAYFAVGDAQGVIVYRTDKWEAVATLPAPDEKLMRIDLYRKPRFLSMTCSVNGGNSTVMVDWQTGEELGRFDNYPVVAETDDAFYVVLDGAFARYHYNADALGERADVLAQSGDTCLARGANRLWFVSAASGALYEAECAPDAEVAFAADLSRVLISQNGMVVCVGADGAALWEASGECEELAVSEDGSRAALLDAQGSVRVLDGADGGELYAFGPVGELPEWGKLAVSRAGVLTLGDRAVFFPAERTQVMEFGAYSRGTLSRDGLTILSDPWAYANDFAVFAADGSLLYKPGDSTSAFAYSPASGYLVRQRAASGGHGTYDLSVLKLHGDGFREAGKITLRDNEPELYLDQTGRYLTIREDGGTRVYDLFGLSCLLDAPGCALRYENGALYADEAVSGRLFCCALPDGDALRDYAIGETTSPLGRRTLTPDEARRYSFVDQ